MTWQISVYPEFYFLVSAIYESCSLDTDIETANEVKFLAKFPIMKFHRKLKNEDYFKTVQKSSKQNTDLCWNFACFHFYKKITGKKKNHY